MTPLDEVIPPEIRNDRLAATLRRIASEPEVRTILEEGSSSGDGSTDAFVRGALENPNGPPELHCIELSPARFRRLKKRHGDRPFVHCHNVSAVRSGRLMDMETIREFCSGVRPWLRRRSVQRYAQWLADDLRHAGDDERDVDGILRIKERFGRRRFGAVLLDGSEFAGPSVLDDVYGSLYLILDDIRALKNHGNHRRLRRDPRYTLVERSWWLRNGYAVFRRTAAAS